MFDDQDIDYLATSLTSEQLRHEIRRADVKAGVARMWAEDEDVFYWEQFEKACRAALAVKRARQPKREVESGKVSVAATKERNDIVEVIGRYTELRKAGQREYMGQCPFHEDRQPSLEVNPEKGLFYCFSCHRKGDVINFVMEAENLSTKDACAFLDNLDGSKGPGRDLRRMKPIPVPTQP